MFSVKAKPPRQTIEVLMEWLPQLYWQMQALGLGGVRTHFCNDGKTKKEAAQGLPSIRRRRIREIVAAFIETKQQARFCIGSESSQEGVEERYERLVQACDRKEDVSFGREDRFEPAELILEHVFDILNVQPDFLQKRGMNSLVRPVAAYALCHYGGFTQREAAALMGLRSGVAVSLQLQMVHDQMQSSRKLKGVL